MNEDNKDALNNLINSIQEKMGSAKNEGNGNAQNPQLDLSSLLNNAQSNNNNSSNFNILSGIQQLMGGMNSNSPQSNLLLSLKPFLRKSRQNKMNDYITILNIITMIGSFRNKGSD